MAEGGTTVNPDMEEGYIVNCPKCGWDEAYVEHQTPNGIEYACDNCGHAWFEEHDEPLYPLANP